VQSEVRYTTFIDTSKSKNEVRRTTCSGFEVADYVSRIKICDGSFPSMFHEGNLTWLCSTYRKNLH